MRKRIMSLATNSVVCMAPTLPQHLTLHESPPGREAAIVLIWAWSFEEYLIYEWPLQGYPVPYVISAESGSGGAEWIKEGGVNLIMYDHKPSTELKFHVRTR